MVVQRKKLSFVALTLGLALTVVSSLPQGARAQDAYSCIDQLSDDEVRYRIDKIEDGLRDGKKHATRWRYTWMSIYLALGGGATGLAVWSANRNDDADKFGWAYLAGGFFFAGVLHAAVPAPDVWGAKRVGRMDASTEAARRAKLEYATETLDRANASQGFFAGAFPIVGATIYGSVGGIIKATQWTGQSRGLTAGMFLAPPIVAGLATATAPKGAMRGWEGYRGVACSSKYYDTHTEGPDLDFSVGPGGGMLRVKF